jgi:hypothetical protein
MNLLASHVSGFKFSQLSVKYSMKNQQRMTQTPHKYVHLIHKYRRMGGGLEGNYNTGKETKYKIYESAS